MKLKALFFVLFVIPSLVMAGDVYSIYGNTIYGSDGSTYSTYGNTTYGSDGTVCSQYGNQVYCN